MHGAPTQVESYIYHGGQGVSSAPSMGQPLAQSHYNNGQPQGQYHVDEDEQKYAVEMEKLQRSKVDEESSIARMQETRMKMIEKSPFYKPEYIEKLESEKAILLIEQNDLKEQINNVLKNREELLNDTKSWRLKYDLKIASEDLDRIKEEGKQLSEDYREFQKINDKLAFHWMLKGQNRRLVCINEQLKEKKKILKSFNKLMRGSTRLNLNTGKGEEVDDLDEAEEFLMSNDPGEDIGDVDDVELKRYLGVDKSP